MARTRSCGIVVAVAACALAVAAPAPAAATKAPCSHPTVRHVGVVSALGCWRSTKGGWRTDRWAQVNGLALSGRGALLVQGRRISTSGPLQVALGPVRLAARGAWSWISGRSATVRFSPRGSLRGIPFKGDGSVRFTAANGGTATLNGRLALPFAGGLTSDVQISTSRKRGFNLKSLHISAAQLPLGRIALSGLQLGYERVGRIDRWKGSVTVAPPVFAAPPAPTFSGRIQLDNGRLKSLGATVKRQIPLGSGFFLTGGSLDVGFRPLTLQGEIDATFGPKIGAVALISMTAGAKYVATPETWSVTGDAKVAEGVVPGLEPEAHLTATMTARRALTVEGEASATIHGYGFSGTFHGQASADAYNAEGDVKVNLPAKSLDGSALVSSRGTAACGRIKILFAHVSVGFGYRWGGGFDAMAHACSFDDWRVVVGTPLALRRSMADLVLPAADVRLFAFVGGDVNLTLPGGRVVSTVGEIDNSDLFVTHDPAQNTAYAIVANLPAGPYTVTPLPGTVLTETRVADAVPEPTVTASVAGTGESRTLTYGVGELVAGETVSFFESSSATDPGANPIVEVGSNGSASTPFAPRLVGPGHAYVWAVVELGGLPRSATRLPGADYLLQEPPQPPPPAATTSASDPPGTVRWPPTKDASGYEVVVTGSTGRHEAAILPAGTTTYTVKPEGSGPGLQLGVSGPIDRFATLTGQQSQVGHVTVGWGQTTFAQLWPRLGSTPMLGVATGAFGSERVTPAAIASGKADAYLFAINAAAAQLGRPLYVRPLPEMNAWVNPYCAFNQDGSRRDAAHSPETFKKAFARIYLIVHGGRAAKIDAALKTLGLPPVGRNLPTPAVTVIWNPQGRGSPEIPGNAPGVYYPGDGFVDMVGDDLYDVNRNPTWAGAEELYAAHPSKPFAFPSWGLQGIDDPAFVERMAQFVQTHPRTHLLAYVSAKLGSQFDLQSKPKSLAAYRDLIVPLGSSGGEVLKIEVSALDEYNQVGPATTCYSNAPPGPCRQP
jgi:hypothetical protein